MKVNFNAFIPISDRNWNIKGHSPPLSLNILHQFLEQS